ncbi:dipicolinate synthase subunit B [Oceanobacillus iheyensis]|uniref:Dipicolinate synthase subunit B n=1 Tax=Oceanobacillus iheyensis (strain DSM 14371 / CIP 107618 / JCM 11309 / KCTC 3954 / HTE831) TaxID=221109 RepID=Q8EQT2_OCEIH|nr:dipicolinate synthase subunit B [Oceanobacillus iheyensis]BAC13565.1 dipicolinate synthase subunit B [Oceanobacillus iheyensis HTE831]
MTLNGKRIGFGLTGSHHTFEHIFPKIEELISLGAEVVAFATETVQFTDTKHGKAADHIERLEEITGHPVIRTIPEAEPFGPNRPLDVMIVAPLTGNSMSKFAHAHTDNSVLMAAKSTLRNNQPVVLGMTTNDALGLNAANLATLLNSKNIYFIPFGQDNPFKKPNSLSAKLDFLIPAVEEALQGKQLQPIIVPYQE